MAETRTRTNHEDVETAIAAFRRGLLESVKTGHWMAACWKVLDDGSIGLAGCTTWEWQDAHLEDAIGTLKKEIAERLGPPPGEDDPLPVADFMQEIEALKSEPKKEEVK